MSKLIAPHTPVFFPSPGAFRRWLARHGSTATELLVGFYKVATGRPSLTWSESVDEALCFGWIDGVRKRIDDESYQIRFTPRRPDSNWSAINIAKVEVLISQGRMQPPGILAYSHRADHRSRVYSYEPRGLPSLHCAGPGGFQRLSCRVAVLQRHTTELSPRCRPVGRELQAPRHSGPSSIAPR